MKIFSTHRKKLEPKRRFGSQEFRSKVKTAAGYKRAFNPINSRFTASMFLKVDGKKIFKMLLLFLVLFAGYFLVISSKFVVTEIDVSGNQQIRAEQIKNVVATAGKSRFFLIKKNDFFLLTPGRLNQMMISAIPTIKAAVNVKRVWPNKIVFEVQEHLPGFVIQSNNKYFLIDDEGTVVSQIPDPKNFLVVTDEMTEDFATGEVLSNSKLTVFVISMSKQWPNKMTTPIMRVKFLGKENPDVEFVSASGWSVFFDITRPVVAQLNSLAVLLNKVIAAKDQPNLAYIDLRLSKWAYYCLKDRPCGQVPQGDTAGTTTNVNQK